MTGDELGNAKELLAEYQRAHGLVQSAVQTLHL